MPGAISLSSPTHLPVSENLADVRFTPESGHPLTMFPLLAKEVPEVEVHRHNCDTCLDSKFPIIAV
jgi:hypothetical protein